MCPTLCDPMDCSLSGSSVHGIFQVRVLKWIAISYSRGSSQPRNRTQVSRIAGRCFAVWAAREAPYIHYIYMLFVYFCIWLCQVLDVALRIFDLGYSVQNLLTVACRSFSCGMRILNCSIWDLAPLLEIKPRFPALGEWSLSHWTTREAPTSPYFSWQPYERSNYNYL